MITDEMVAELEAAAKARANLKHGQCEGGQWLRGRECASCGRGPQERCGMPLPEPYSNPATILALLAERAELIKDAERLDWLADPENAVGNVQLPTKCVLDNVHSLRDAIDSSRAFSLLNNFDG